MEQENNIHYVIIMTTWLDGKSFYRGWYYVMSIKIIVILVDTFKAFNSISGKFGNVTNGFFRRC